MPSTLLYYLTTAINDAHYIHCNMYVSIFTEFIECCKYQTYCIKK